MGHELEPEFTIIGTSVHPKPREKTTRYATVRRIKRLPAIAITLP
jgi:hypothetical protein